MGALDAEAESAVFEQEARERKAEGITGLSRYYIQWGYKCQWLAELPAFNNFIVFIICMAGINVGMQLDAPFESKEGMNALDTLDDVILCIFAAEVVIKVIAEKLQPWCYFFDAWNRFDFIIVVGSMIPGTGNTIMLVRLLRLFRVLKLVKKLPQLAVIVNALMTAMSSISYVALILLLAFYVFAILGMLLFKQNDPWHFKNLHLSMLALFRAATLDEWNELMYLEMYGCERFPDVYEDFPGCDPTAHGPYSFGIALSYFTLFITLVANVFLTLFIGVISTSMDESRNAQREEFKIDEKIAEVRDELGLSVGQLQDFKTVFDILDLDGGGTIDETELQLGLCLIDDDHTMSEADTAKAFQKIDPEGTGSIDICGFIQFMCMTPKYRLNALKKKTIRYWEKATKKKVVDTFYDRLKRLILYGAYNDEKQRAIKAALVIQSVWKSRRQAAALREMEAAREKKKTERSQRRLLRNNSILMDDDSDDSDEEVPKFVNEKRKRARAINAIDSIISSQLSEE